jgi:hypothetical protein
MDVYEAKLLKWQSFMDACNDKVNYYHKKLQSATQDQKPHFNAKMEEYLAKRKTAEAKYLMYTDLFLGDEYVKYLPLDMRCV